MLETIREYAGEQLETAGEADELRRRHADYFLALGETANLSAESQGPERPEVVRAEQDDFRAAIDWALDHDPELAFRLVIALEQFWVMNDAFEGIRRLSAVLEHGSRVPQVLRARALRTHGEAAWISGDLEGGSRLMGEALTEFRQLGDEQGVAVVLHRLAVGAIVGKDLPLAGQLLDECLATSAGNPSPSSSPMRSGSSARSSGRRGAGARARALRGECGAMREDRPQVGTGDAVLNVADLADEMGRTDLAWKRGRELSSSAEGPATGKSPSTRSPCWPASRDRRARRHEPADFGAQSGRRGARPNRLLGTRARPTRLDRRHLYTRVRDRRSTGRSLLLDEAVEYALGEE